VEWPIAAGRSGFKKRKAWWAGQTFIVICSIYLLVAVGGVIGLRELGYKYVDVTFAFFWSVLMAGLVIYYRAAVSRTEEEKVDKAFVEARRLELLRHRSKVRKEFLETEIEVLRRGEKSPVLDIWRLDEQLQKRHVFFSCLDGVYLDPREKELQIRIQSEETVDKQENFNALVRLAATFFDILSLDPYLEQLFPFFERMVLEVYGVRENEEHRDVPYPLLSAATTKKLLMSLRTRTQKTFDLKAMGEVRISDKGDIVPHRSIETSHKITGK
jgi:hypothetical protein